MAQPEQLFPSIGTVADQTDQLPEVEDGTVSTDLQNTEEKATQEIESLCMKCGEQVYISTLIPFSLLTTSLSRE